MADHSISIDVNERGGSETLRILKEIRDSVNNLKTTHVSIDVKANVQGITRSLNEIKRDINEIAAMNVEADSARFEGALEFLGGAFDKVIEKIDEVNSRQVDPSGIEEAASGAERLAAGLDVAAGIAASLSTVFSGLGDFGGIFANAFEGMSGIFKTDIASTALKTLTANATNAVTSQMSGIIGRYDIMNTFSDYMELAGVDKTSANAALNAVDQSIRGVPIGLDESAFRLRKYQMYLGDIDRATQFTIGIQKAITAGGATESMKSTAYNEIDRLLATGKLSQSRQWLSLFNGLGVSLKFLREELALDPTADLKTIAADLANGTIATDDFIDAIARLSDNEGLDRTIEIYKGTIEAWMSNINNAVKRGGQKVMESANDVMEDVYGMGITGVMKAVRDEIDTVSADAAQYIRDNPNNVQMLGDTISGLVDRFLGLDGGRFVTNVVTNLSGLGDTVARIFDSIPDGFLEDFSSFAMTWAGPMATVMKAAQSGLPMILGIFEGLKDWDMGSLMEKITDEIGRMAGFIGTIMGALPEGLMGDLMAFGLVWGKPLAQVLGTVSGALKDISGVVSAGGAFSSANGIVGQLTSLAMNHPLIAAAAAAIGALAIAFESYWQAIQEADMQNLETNVGDISDLISKTDTVISNSAKASENWSENIDSFTEKANQAHDAVEKIEELNQQIEELSNPLPYSGMDETRDKLLAERLGQIEKLSAMFPNLRLEIDETTGALTEQSKIMLSQADAYIDYMTGVSMTQAYREGIEGETSNIVSLRNERDTLVERQGIARDYLRRINGEVRYYQQQMAAMQAEADEMAWNIIDMPGYSELSEKLADAQRSQTLAKGAVLSIDGEIRDVDEAIQKSFDTIDKYGRSLSELRAQQVRYSGSEWWYDGEKTALEDLDENLQNIIADYQLMKDEATQAAKSMIGGFEAIEGVQSKPLSTTNSTLSGNNEKGQYYYDQLALLQNWMDGELLTEEGQKFLEENGYAIQALIDQAESDFGDRGLLYGLVDAITGGDTEAVSEYFQTQLDQLNLEEGIGGLTADIEAMIKYGKEWKDFRDENKDEDEFAWMKNLTDGIVGPLVEMAENLAPGGEVGEAITEASTQTVEGVVSAMEPVKGALDDVKSSANDAENAISDLATTASGKAGEMSSFASSLGEVAGAATSAFTQVSALAGAIARLQDKTVNIRVNVSAGFGRLARGGMAGYFASGGNVALGFPGMASGTDILPAWLTPGEYVMRRSAVGLFGSRFMDRVNKMDIGGAFDALMSRISYLGGNTYNRDNHATVNNYFYGDGGQNYSQRKAYRFVGGL